MSKVDLYYYFEMIALLSLYFDPCTIFTSVFTKMLSCI